ncbi:MAG TPA: sterol desaturase family protein [Polyangiales bacterium]|nr:sterol desaturase family protein [Polyangiales bacterium]
MGLIYYAIPFFLATLVLEHWLVSRKVSASEEEVKLAGFTTKDSFASLSMGIGFLLINALLTLLPFAGLAWLYQFRLFDIPVVWWSWILLLFAEDFCYYWFHRLHHEVRALWAAHVNHHSSTHYNLTTALRQSWTTPFTGFIFWVPLPLLGFPIEMILIQKSISLLYQYWLHTELIAKLGWFESVFNTPSHHRVHHGRNPVYLDRNHAGIFIIWDKMFGTFEPEAQAVDYGLTKNIHTYNPVRIAFHEWYAMLRDAWNARTWRGRFGYLLMPPGWTEDGHGKTSHALRVEYLAEKGV